MVIRVMAMPDCLDLPDFDDVFRAILGWDGLGFIFRVHGQEFNSFRRRTQSKTLRDFQLRTQEKFLYTSGRAHNAADLNANVLHAMSVGACCKSLFCSHLRLQLLSDSIRTAESRLHPGRLKGE
jgi:hypothetical protein